VRVDSDLVGAEFTVAEASITPVAEAITPAAKAGRRGVASSPSFASPPPKIEVSLYPFSDRLFGFL
jgi:hypothetical protein